MRVSQLLNKIPTDPFVFLDLYISLPCMRVCLLDVWLVTLSPDAEVPESLAQATTEL